MASLLANHGFYSVLTVLMLWIFCAPHSSLLPGTSLRVSATQEKCPTTMSPPDSSIEAEQRGHGAFLSSAESTRQAIIDRELPFAAVRSEIRRSYQAGDPAPIPQLVAEWLKYVQNTLYLSGFVAFVGVVLPVVMVLLWVAWERSYEEEEEEEECKNESRCAQVVAWTLVIISIILTLGIFGFVGVLLAGNSRVSQGVSGGSGAVAALLPEVVRVREESVLAVNETVLRGYRSLLDSLYLAIGNIPREIQRTVTAESDATAQEFHLNVTSSLSRHPTLLNHAQLLHNSLRNLTQTADLAFEVQLLNNSLNDLIDLCTVRLEGSEGVNDELDMECTNLIATQGNGYVPDIPPSVETLRESFNANRPLLQRLLEILENETFSGMTEVIDSRPDYFSVLTQNLTERGNAILGEFYGEGSGLYGNLTRLVEEVQVLNVSLSLNMPTSQERVMTFLGPQYLENWEEFRSLCTVAFALIVLGIGVCLIVAMGRGLYCVHDIYVNGGETSNQEGVHQAATMIKKLSFVLTGVCVVSALTYGTALVLAGGVGGACSPHGNLSDVLRHVVDENSTWGGVHLMGDALLRNAAYPLTFESALVRCGQNNSIYQSFQLQNRFPLDEYFFLANQHQGSFSDSLRELREVSAFIVLTPSVRGRLQLLGEVESLPVPWEELTGISLEVTRQGLESAQTKVLNMQTALQSSSAATNFTAPLNEASSVLSSLSSHLRLLSSLQNHTRTLQRTLTMSNSSALLKGADALEGHIRTLVASNTNSELTMKAFTINHRISEFLHNTKCTLQEQTGSCHTLFRLYTQFSLSLCEDVVPGLDLYWTSFFVIFFLSITLMVLSLLLASRLVNFRLDKSNKFHLTRSVLRQVRAALWFVVGMAINVWLVVAIARDEYFHDVACEGGGGGGGCCPTCVWAFGAVFLVLSVLVGGVSRLYQCAILHRLSKGIKKVRRYWMEKKKAAQFHGQLAVLIIQDIPFLILAGVYTSRTSLLTVPAFFSMIVSLLGIGSYLIYIFRERSSIRNHCLCLRNFLKGSTKFHIQGDRSPHGGGSVNGVVAGIGGGGRVNGVSLAMNGRGLNGRYIGSESEQSESDSQGTTQHVEDWMYNSAGGGGGGGFAGGSAAGGSGAGGQQMDHRLSVIPEHNEGAENLPPQHHRHQPAGGVGGGVVGTSPSPPLPSIRGVASLEGRGRNMTVPVYMHAQDSDSETHHSRAMHLDRVSSPTESALRQRREAAARGIEGIEVASSVPPYDDTSASYFGSKTSMAGSDVQGYYTSSLPPDEMYESSDGRDDYDSDYSHTNAQRNMVRLTLNSGLQYNYEMSVDV